MKYVLFAARKLPAILQPEYRNNLGAIHFEDTGKTAKGGGKGMRANVDHLDTTIESVATVWNAFDSGKNRVAHLDEQSKIRLDSKKNLTTLHNNAIATVWQGLIRVGYIIYTHYVSENNDDSFREAKTIYYNSKLRTIDESGRTRSDMICLALLVTDGIFGGCNIYGEPELDKIWRVINAGMEKRKDDPTALRSYRRQYPTTEEDCWQEGAGEHSIFDNLRLGQKLHVLAENESFSERPYIDFNFAWTTPPEIDEIRSIYNFPGRVMVVPVSDDEKRKGKEHGIWKWYRKEWTPEDWLKNHVNQFLKDDRGRFIPNPGSPFYMSIDPTQYSAAHDVVVGSKNAMHVFVLPNKELDGRFNEVVSNKRLMAEYHYRSESPRDTLMHVVQALLYFGCYVLIECNANWLATRLIELGFARFLIRVNEETKLLEPYSSAKKQKPFTSQRSINGSNDTISDYTAAGMMHINDYSYMDNVAYLESEAVIKDLINFDPMNTQKFDSGVCYLIGLLGMNTYLGWKQRHQNKIGANADPAMRQIARALLT